MFIIKFALYFSFSFLLLAFPIGQKSLFERINEYTEPVTHKVYKNMLDTIGSGIKTSKNFTSKLFLNSVPPSPQNKQTITRQESAISRQSQSDKPLEELTNEERNNLIEVIENSY